MVNCEDHCNNHWTSDMRQTKAQCLEFCEGKAKDTVCPDYAECLGYTLDTLPCDANTFKGCGGNCLCERPWCYPKKCKK